MKTILQQLADYRLMNGMNPPISTLVVTDRVNGVNTTVAKIMAEQRYDSGTYERFMCSEVLRESGPIAKKEQE